MRVSHRNIYANVINYTNTSLRELMELNLKASSQKKINRPSDDPVGMSRILNYKDSLKSLEQYRRNISTAQGWLGLADASLIQTSNVIIRLKELAQQAATGTVSEENRKQISYEVNQLFQQLITLANSSYEGKHIFSGHKTDAPAFRQALFAQGNGKGTLDGNIVSVEGGTSGTILVQFLADGVISTQPDFRYSTDGGKTWQTGEYVIPPPVIGEQVLNLGGVRVTVNDTATVVPNDPDDFTDTSGTWLWVRPTAVYQGDDEDQIEVEYFGAVPGVDPSASGLFRSNVMVRVDAVGATIDYSFSTDGGRNWNTGNAAPAGPPASLPVPGGFLGLAGASPAAGDQFVIRPNRALMHVEISQNETIQINNIGKEVFGGLYPDASGNLQPVPLGREGSGSNLFETVGKLVGYLETNTQQGVQEALDDLEDAHKHITTYLAGVGGRENRLFITEGAMMNLQINLMDRKSKLEDVDVAELMTKMAMQQITYEAVLKSSNLIMRMSLVNFI